MLKKKHYFSDSFHDDKYSQTESNYTYRFMNDNLEITCDVETVTTNRFIQDELRFNKKNYKRVITIPLNKLNNKNFIIDGFVVFTADYNAFIIKDSDKSNEDRGKWHGFRVNIYGEERFTEKFNKAMLHLLSFVKKSDSKDLF